MIGLVVNPNARGVTPAIAEKLRALLGRDGELALTRTPEDLAAAVARFAERGADLIAACGGDGTNLSVFTEAVRRFGADRLPRFAVLRGGTVNTIANNLGIQGTPDAILARVVGTRRAGRPPLEAGQDLLRVGTDGDAMYGFLFAAAMGARFLEAYYGGPVQGPAWAGLLAARTIGSSFIQGRFARWLFQDVPVEVIADGERLALEGARLLLASTVPDVGIGMRVTWQAGRQPGRFHLVASALPTPKMALQLDRVLRGRPLAGSPHVDRLVQSATIRFDAAETFTLDGELFRRREVAIAVGPRVWIVKG